jgi:hypothetical protein
MAPEKILQVPSSGSHFSLANVFGDKCVFQNNYIADENSLQQFKRSPYFQAGFGLMVNMTAHS